MTERLEKYICTYLYMALLAKHNPKVNYKNDEE